MHGKHLKTRTARERFGDFRAVPAVLLAVVLALMVGVGSSFAYVVAQAPPIVNTFVSGVEEQDGSLTIRVSTSGSGYALPSGLAFPFTIDLGAENANATFGAHRADDLGVIRLSIGANQSITIPDIPAGVSAVVTESLAGHPGFSSPQTRQTATISAREESVLTFHNSYYPGPASMVQVTGEKVVIGRTLSAGDSFTYLVERQVGNRWVEVGQKRVVVRMREIDGQLVVDPESLRFDLADVLRSVSLNSSGTHAFRVTEIANDLGPGSSQSGVNSPVSEFVVRVGDSDADGWLEARAASTSTPENTSVSAAHVHMTFTSTYLSDDEAAISINVSAVLKDASGQNLPPSGFEFVLYDADGKALASAITSDSGKASIISEAHGAQDVGKTFDYELKQVHGGETIDALTYDGTVYEIQVAVVRADNGSVAAYVYDRAEAVASQTEAAGAGGRGAVSAEAASGDGEKAANGGRAVGSDSTAGSGRSAGDGPATIGGRAPDGGGDRPVAEGERASEGGSAESAQTDAELTIQAVPAGATDVFEAEFVNVYRPESASVVLEGTTTLEGRDLQESQFHVALYRTDSSFDVEGREPEQVVANVDADGNFSFDPLVFDQVGTYFFTVIEREAHGGPDVGGLPDSAIRYDEAVYHVVVEVADAGGKLVARTDVTDAWGNKAVLSFVNVYAKSSNEPGAEDADGQRDGLDGDSGRGSAANRDVGGGAGASPQTGDRLAVIVRVLVVIAGLVALVVLVAADVWLRRHLPQREDPQSRKDEQLEL